MSPRVVVTRPVDEAQGLAEELAQRGYEPLVAPMLAIEFLKAPVPPLAGYSALAFTSANGVRAFVAQCDERDMPVYAVGDQTARALAAAGFGDVRSADGDAEALASMIAADRLTRPILHVSGKAIARDLGTLLAPAGVRVDRVELYDSRTATMLPSSLVAALSACTVTYVLFFSTRTASAFGTLVKGAGLTPTVRSTTAICLSSQVASGASGLPWMRVEVARRPRMLDMLALLPIL
jgi:uroporphyrinogen-III synthase